MILSVDPNDNKIISIAIHQASKAENEIHWNEYFKPLIEALFMRECMQQGIFSNVETPASMIRDNNSQHLLHVAAKEGLPWYGTKHILESNVDAVRVQDMETGLVPFMIAAEGLKSDLSTIFEILPALPETLIID